MVTAKIFHYNFMQIRNSTRLEKVIMERSEHLGRSCENPSVSIFLHSDVKGGTAIA